MRSILKAIIAVPLLFSAASSACVSEVEIITAQAPAVLLIDAGSGQVLHANNPTRRFIPASMTKVMTAYVAFEKLAAGELELDQTFSFREEAAEDWYRTGSTMFLEPGEQVSIDALLRGITAISANDGSIVLAEGSAGSVAAWTEAMNKTAGELGMRESHFGTPNGWPDDGKTFTTANDLAILAKAMIANHPDLYARYFGKDGFRHNGIAQANHDPISGVVDGADGIKTGFTNQAGHGFLGSAQRGSTRLIMVVGGVDSEIRRAEISRDLIEWGFDEFQRVQLFGKGAIIGTAVVQNGEAADVTLVGQENITIALPKEERAAPVFTLNYEGPLEAPIVEGEQVAFLEMRIGGELKARIPLLAAEDVPQAGFLTRVTNAFEGWIE